MCSEGWRGIVSFIAAIQHETGASTNTSGRRQLKTDGDEELSHTTKPLHEVYRWWIDEVVDLKKPKIQMADLQDTTESLIIDTQPWAIGTRYIETGVYHSWQKPSPRLHKGASLIIPYVVAECKTQAHTYIERHNQVAGILCMNICAKYGLEIPKFW